MVRIRLYGLVLSLPVIVLLIGLTMSFFIDSISWFGIPVGWLLAMFGIALQMFFGLTIACPKCGKSPYALGPFVGPLSFAGKPWPDATCSNCGHNFLPPMKGQ